MKRLYFLICISFFCLLNGVSVSADDELTYQINIQHRPHGGTHNEIYPPADMPDAVYYDIDAEEIVIEADGMFTSYYNVLIIRNSTNQTMISTQISGYGDSIDVSSLPSDNYTLVLTTESNNVYEGQFTIQ